jgi:hypothetical protein
MHNDKELRLKVKPIGLILGNVLKNYTNKTVFEVVETLTTGYF